MAYYKDTVVSSEVPQRRELEVLGAGHPAVGAQCLVCEEDFAEGDAAFFVFIGPGADTEAREAAAARRPHNTNRVLVHSACAIGY